MKLIYLIYIATTCSTAVIVPKNIESTVIPILHQEARNIENSQQNSYKDRIEPSEYKKYYPNYQEFNSVDTQKQYEEPVNINNNLYTRVLYRPEETSQYYHNPVKIVDNLQISPINDVMISNPDRQQVQDTRFSPSHKEQDSFEYLPPVSEGSLIKSYTPMLPGESNQYSTHASVSVQNQLANNNLIHQTEDKTLPYEYPASTNDLAINHNGLPIGMDTRRYDGIQQEPYQTITQISTNPPTYMSQNYPNPIDFQYNQSPQTQQSTVSNRWVHTESTTTPLPYTWNQNSYTMRNQNTQSKSYFNQPVYGDKIQQFQQASSRSSNIPISNTSTFNKKSNEIRTDFSTISSPRLAPQLNHTKNSTLKSSMTPLINIQSPQVFERSSELIANYPTVGFKYVPQTPKEFKPSRLIQMTQSDDEEKYAKSYYHPSTASTQQRTTTEGIPILKQMAEMALDGSYIYETLTGDQTHIMQQGHIENPGTDHEEQVMRGSYSFIGSDGKTYKVSYIADANGFRAIGDHLPTPHPIPEIIQRSIELNLAEEVARATQSSIPYQPESNIHNYQIKPEQQAQARSFVHPNNPQGYRVPYNIN